MLLLQAQVEQAVTEVAENPVLTEVVEAANEMNLWDMAVKGGWIMIVLALLSVLSIYIFVERLMAIRKASKVDPVFMERIRDYVKTDELKSAINYCRVAGTPAANMIEKGIERIDVCGIAGDICVLQTLRDGVELFGPERFHVLEAFAPSLDGGASLSAFVKERLICTR